MIPTPTSTRSFWTLPSDEILKSLQGDASKGLTNKEAKARLKKYGENVLKVKKGYGTLALLFAQFNTPLIYLLLFAAALSLILYDSTDALIIFGIIIISTLLSFFQERSAVQAMEELLKIVQVKITVIRDGEKLEIPLERVVPGDLVELNAGDIIPGDCCLLEARDLYIDEATLTGESFSSEKRPGVVDENTPLAKRTNVIFMGTHVISGTALAVVVKTGINTVFGEISDSLKLTAPETDFEHGIRAFGYFLMEVTFVLLLIIFAFNMYLERPVVESLLFALSLAVGLTPQLLPAIITINLAHGAKQMAKQQVIVKKLASIENFGSMNILCADKTGTLTTGEIKLKNACDYNGAKSEKVLLYGYLNASFQTGYKNPIDTAISAEEHQDISKWTKLDEYPYDFIRKRISVLVKNENSRLMITKGAVKEVLEACTHAEIENGAIVDIVTVQDAIQERFKEFSNSGYRVLGVSYLDGEGINILDKSQEAKMIFLGFLLFEDPIKADVESTIAELKNLGVSLKIITGDNKLVAMHFAKIFGVPEDQLLTGSELRKMNGDALVQQVKNKSIFAEIEPNQKEQIILALKKAGNVVGFLGDGINDVTALHTADVSISVNSGADAAKEVANIVLMKKDLSVLIDGVKAGRMTFANTLKYIFMASSANFGNMFSMAGISLFLNFLPLLPKQVLLTNLLTDFPEMTIATDRVDEEMVSKPLRWDIKFIRKFMLVFGLISSVFDYATFGVLLLLNASVEQFRTGWFVESVCSATAIVLVIRTFRPFFTSLPSVYLLGTVILVIFSTLILPMTPLAHYLGLTSLTQTYYWCIAIIVILYMTTVEIAKKIFLQRWLLTRK